MKRLYTTPVYYVIARNQGDHRLWSRDLGYTYDPRFARIHDSESDAKNYLSSHLLSEAMRPASVVRRRSTLRVAHRKFLGGIELEWPWIRGYVIVADALNNRVWRGPYGFVTCHTRAILFDKRKDAERFLKTIDDTHLAQSIRIVRRTTLYTTKPTLED